jgi:HSP20 family protein
MGGRNIGNFVQRIENGMKENSTMTEATATVKQPEPQPQTETTRGGNIYRPSVDIVENEQELLLHADLPGLREEDLDIHFENGTLTLHGRTPYRRVENAEYLLEEYGVGDYYRTFKVSEKIDPARISAQYQAGVLTLRLPKVEEAKPRKIAVKVG